MIESLLRTIGVAAVCVAITIFYYEGLSLPFVGQVVDGVISHRIEAVTALYEKTTATAKQAEQKRQEDAVNSAVAAYQRRLAEAQASETQAQSDLEQEVSQYESRLAALKRQCLADSDDVNFIMRHH